MVLHFVCASSTAATGAGTEDTLASSAYSPSGENEVQERTKEGGLPSLIGISGVLGDLATAGSATGGPYYKITMNTWPQAQYIKRPWHCWGTANAGGAPVITGITPVEWLDKPILLDRDADFTISYMSTSANVCQAIGLFESYGSKIPWIGAPDTWRLVSAAADLTANVWGTIGTISDLDPRVNYRVSTLMGVSEDQPLLAIRLRGPSNSTYAGCLCNQIQAAATQPPPWRVDLVPDSITVSGVDTITIEGLVDAAHKPSVYIGFTQIGKFVASSSGATVSTKSPSASGTIGRLLGTMAGGMR